MAALKSGPGTPIFNRGNNSYVVYIALGCSHLTLGIPFVIIKRLPSHCIVMHLAKRAKQVLPQPVITYLLCRSI